MTTNRILNWKRDPKYKDLPEHQPSKLLKAVPLPRKTDVTGPLVQKGLTIADQKSWGSCTANSSGRAVEAKMLELGMPLFRVARMGVYYWEREFFGSIREDSGGTNTCAIQMMMKWGIPNEALWPYVDSNFARKPMQRVYDEAAKYRLANVHVARIKQDHDHFVAMLAAGNVIIGGFDVPKSFMGRDVAKTGIWKGMTQKDTIEGGHSVAIVGSDDDTGEYIIDNSWGTGWGARGRVRMPMEWWHNRKRCSDFIAVVNLPR